MGKDLKGKELGVGFRQKSSGMYSARHVDRFGNRKEIYDRNFNELKRKLSVAIYDDYNRNNVVENSMNLAEWFEKWLDVHKYKVIRPTTIVMYKNIFNKHIKPALGKNKIKDITQIHIKTLLKNLDKNGLGFETQNRVKIMLHDMFDKAMIDDYVLKNPCKGIKVARNEKKDIRVLSLEEQKEFFECCSGTFYNNLFIVAIHTGLRQGELCGLTLNDINFEKKEIIINKTLLYQKLDGETSKMFHLSPPKTKTSYRTVRIDKQCEIALKKQYLQRNNIMSKQSAKPVKGFENLMFTTKFGTPICDQILIDAIKKILNEINDCRDDLEKFEYFSPHCFRHTFATRCFEADVPPKTVQKYLGHATLQMTMDLYTHVLSNRKQEDMEKFEKYMDDNFGNSDEQIEEHYERLKEPND